jgi:hypothetical protein
MHDHHIRRRQAKRIFQWLDQSGELGGSQGCKYLENCKEF